MNGPANKRILLVEDDYYEASELTARLEANGVEVAGPAPTVDQALKLIRAEKSLTGAILNINLGGETVFPVADELEKLGLPFIFATGYERDDIPFRYADKTLLRKPVDDEAILAALEPARGADRGTIADASSINTQAPGPARGSLHHIHTCLRQ